jgi:hypothetical protein
LSWILCHFRSFHFCACALIPSLNNVVTSLFCPPNEHHSGTDIVKRTFEENSLSYGNNSFFWSCSFHLLPSLNAHLSCFLLRPIFAEKIDCSTHLYLYFKILACIMRGFRRVPHFFCFYLALLACIFQVFCSFTDFNFHLKLLTYVCLVFWSFLILLVFYSGGFVLFAV